MGLMSNKMNKEISQFLENKEKWLIVLNINKQIKILRIKC